MNNQRSTIKTCCTFKLLTALVALLLLVGNLDGQDIAGTYQSAANAYRQAAAQTTGQRSACYTQWAQYYDCLASQLGSNPSATCGQPTCDPNSGGTSSTPSGAQPNQQQLLQLQKQQAILNQAAQIGRNNNNNNLAIQGSFSALGNLLQNVLNQQEQRDQQQRSQKLQEQQASEAAQTAQTLAEGDAQVANWQQLRASEPSGASANADSTAVSPADITSPSEQLGDLLKADGADTTSAAPTATDGQASNSSSQQPSDSPLSDLLKTDRTDNNSSPPTVADGQASNPNSQDKISLPEDSPTSEIGMQSTTSSDSKLLSLSSDANSEQSPSPDTSNPSHDGNPFVGDAAKETVRTVGSQLLGQVQNGEDVDVQEAARGAISETLKGAGSEVFDSSLRGIIEKLPDDNVEVYYDTFVSPKTRVLTPWQAAKNIGAYYHDLVGKRMDEFFGLPQSGSQSTEEN